MHQSVVWKMVFEALADLTKLHPESAEWVQRRIAQDCGHLNDLHLAEVGGVLRTVAELEPPVRREHVDPETEEVTVE
jgi:hypothetical protein